MKHYLIDFDIWDWNKVWHLKSIKHYFNVNIDPKTIINALNQSFQIMNQKTEWGIDDICNEYDDMVIQDDLAWYLYEIWFFTGDISMEDILVLKDNNDKLSIQEWSFLPQEEKDNCHFIIRTQSDYYTFDWSKDFVKMLLLMIKSQLPLFEYNETEETNNSENVFEWWYAFEY